MYDPQVWASPKFGLSFLKSSLKQTLYLGCYMNIGLILAID